MFANPLLFNEQSHSAIAAGIAIPAKQYSPYFFICSPILSLEQLLNTPRQHYFEVGKHKPLEQALEQVSLTNPDFALCLTSRTTYHIHISEIITQSLNKRFTLNNQLSIQISTCLQETIQNAVVHGNLGIKSQFEDNASFENYYELIQTMLSKEPLGHRRVTVSAWCDDDSLTLSVSDQGAGFQLPEAGREHTLLHGRGLHMVNELASEVWMNPEDSRSIYMKFGLHS